MFESTYDVPSDRDGGPTILIVDDEELGRDILSFVCSSLNNGEPPRTVFAKNIPQALDVLSTTPVQLMLLDKNLKSQDGEVKNGIHAIPDFLRVRPNLPILVVTGEPKHDDTALALDLGALGYLTKDSPKPLMRAQILRALGVGKIQIEKARLERAASVFTGTGISGQSLTTQQLLQKVAAVAESNKPVLLLGETGTGKTTVARLIHECRNKYLKQSDRPFMSVKISTIPDSLVERELFGSERGAYTGSLGTHQGFIELANTGTLFLDEIGEISTDIQGKLLSVLQDGKFFRIGGTREIKSSFRLICATNQDLEEMVREKKFREDLYMRISTFPIMLPSLRERRNDIPEIVKAILPRLCDENHVAIEYDDLPKDFIAELMRNPPKGNIRGVEHIISRLLVFSPRDESGKPNFRSWRFTAGIGASAGAPDNKRTAITLEELQSRPLDVGRPGFPGFAEFLDFISDKMILDAQEKLRRNRDIARTLGISDAAVSQRLKRLRNKDKPIANGGGRGQHTGT